MKTNLVSRIVSFAAFSCFFLCSTPARAQIPDALYRDAKDVIEDLIVTEARTSISANLACRSSGLRIYYGKALKDVYEGYLGNLRTTLRDETLDLVADWAYQSIKQQNPIPINQLIPVNWVDAGCDGDKGKKYNMKSDFGSSSYHKNCDSSEDSLDIACLGAKSIRATLGGQHEIAEQMVARMVISLFQSFLDAHPPLNEKPSLSQDVMARIASIIRNAEVSKLPSELEYSEMLGFRYTIKGLKDNDPSALLKLLSQPLIAGKIYASAMMLEEELSKATVSINGKEHPLWPADASLGAAMKGKTFKRILWNLTDATDGGPTLSKEELQAYLTNIQRISQAAQALRAELQVYGDVPQDARWIVLSAVLAAKQVGSVWSFLSATRKNKIDLFVLGRILLRNQGPLSSLCTFVASPERSACAIKKLTDLIPGNEALKAFQEAALDYPQRQDYRRIATSAVTSAFELDKDLGDDPSEQEKLKRLYGRFLRSLVAFSLDASGEGASAATRAALKKETTDLLHEISEGRGLDKRAGYPIWGSPFPTLALRASYSEAHRSANNNASRRLTASVEWLSGWIRLWSSDLTFLMLQGSLLDPLSPLAELASRDSTVRYSSQALLSLMVVKPRATLLYGIPSLSNHLVVGVGASLNLIAPVPQMDGSYSYKIIGQESGTPTLNANREFRHLEFGATLGYVF